jgi:hypothetical protein
MFRLLQDLAVILLQTDATPLPTTQNRATRKYQNTVMFTYCKDNTNTCRNTTSVVQHVKIIFTIQNLRYLQHRQFDTHHRRYLCHRLIQQTTHVHRGLLFLCITDEPIDYVQWLESEMIGENDVEKHK